MQGLQPIKFEPRTYHPTCHWLAGLNHCSSATSNVKWYFYLPPPLLLETHTYENEQIDCRTGAKGGIGERYTWKLPSDAGGHMCEGSWGPSILSQYALPA